MPKQWKLTSNRLSLKGGKFTHFIGKAWHCKVVLGFLVDFTANLDVDPLLKTVLWAAQNVFGVLSESRTRSVFLLPSEIQQVQTVGQLFLEVYLRLRVKYTGWCIYKLFNVRPKFHILTHLITDMVRVRNPVAASGWMDEDFLKGAMRIARKTHISTTQSSTLMRYLTGRSCSSCFFHIILFRSVPGLRYIFKSGPQFCCCVSLGSLNMVVHVSSCCSITWWFTLFHDC